MVRLDGDELALKQGCRDLVQFVKYRDIETSSRPEHFDDNLTSALLEEIPL